MFKRKYSLMDPEPAAGGAAPVKTPLADPGTPAADPGTPAADPGTPAADPGTPATSWVKDGVPDDWRQQLAGDDSKKMNQLQRYTSFEAFVDSAWEAKEKIRSGEIASGLPENPTDEQLVEYREANGIPTDPSGYEKAINDTGLVLGDEDQAMLGEMYPIALKHNLKGEALAEMTDTLLRQREVEIEGIKAADQRDMQVSMQALKETWGAENETNMNIIRATVATMPQEIQDNFLNARMADGGAIFNNPQFSVWLADIGRKLNPSAAVLPNSNNPVGDINAEIKKLEDRMGTPEWYKDKEANDRLMQLYDAKANLEKQ